MPNLGQPSLMIVYILLRDPSDKFGNIRFFYHTVIKRMRGGLMKKKIVTHMMPKNGFIRIVNVHN